MTEQRDTKKQPAKPTSREERLKAALKANLARRKAQARVRNSAEQTQTSQDDT